MQSKEPSTLETFKQRRADRIAMLSRVIWKPPDAWINAARRGKIPRRLYPPDLLTRQAVRVFVGGCVLRGVGSKFRAKAHAHKDGWICFRSDRWLFDRNLVLHELAHVIAGQGHTNRWRKILLEIGGTLEETESLRSYQKRTRA